MFFVSFSLDHLIDSWISNSTNSYHMTPNKDWLDTYKLVNFGSILMSNDDSCTVIGIKNNKITLFDGDIRTM